MDGQVDRTGCRGDRAHLFGRGGVAPAISHAQPGPARVDEAGRGRSSGRVPGADREGETARSPGRPPDRRAGRADSGDPPGRPRRSGRPTARAAAWNIRTERGIGLATATASANRRIWWRSSCPRSNCGRSNWRWACITPRSSRCRTWSATRPWFRPASEVISAGSVRFSSMRRFVHRRRPGGPNRLPVTGVGGEIQPGSRLLRRFLSAGADQWGFQTRWCEKRKRDITQDITLASLPPERFASAFEPGCAIGVLTSELAERCDRVLATDVSPAPLTIARRRLAGRAGVRLQRLRVPQAWPPGRFDLVVLSEIGYYCGTVDLTQLIAVASSSLTDDGLLPTAIGGIRWRTVR